MTRRPCSSVLLAIGVLGGLAGCGHSKPAPAPTPPITITQLPPTPPMLPKPHIPVATFGDGKYEVLTDIVAGEYKSTGNATGNKCYWARLKDFKGEVTSIIAMRYDNNGPDVVVIAPTDKGFETSNCGTWTLVAPR
jgi:hypothetical protein